MAGRYSAFLLLAAVSAQSLSGYISGRPELSSLSAYINSSPVLMQLVAGADNFTFLAPNNNAISNFLAENYTRDLLDVTFTYHFLQGTHTSASLQNRPQLLVTALTNTTYTNVTGGQRVKSFNDGHIVFESSLKNASNIITADLIAEGGLIHVIDTVLEVPLGAFDTVSRVKLSNSLEILSRGNYFSRGNLAFMNSIGITSDLTILMPNSSMAVANFNTTGRNQTDLNTQIQYHCVDRLLYGTDFVNESELMTLAGVPLYITIDEDGSIYVNAAKVTATDYLLANGVLHVINDMLNPNNITRHSETSHATASPSASGPASATDSAEDTDSDGLSTGATVGIGVGVGVGVLALISLGFFFYRRRRASQAWKGTGTDNRGEPSSGNMTERHQLETMESAAMLHSDAMEEIHQLETKEIPAELRGGSMPPVEMYVEPVTRMEEQQGTGRREVSSY